MKKHFLLTILFISLISCSINLSLADEGNSSSSTLSSKYQSFTSTSNNFLSKDTSMPPTVQNAVKVLFRLPDTSQISLQQIVILTALLLIVIIILKEICVFVPFFEGWKSWPAAIIIGLLGSISGGIKEGASFFFFLSNAISFLQKYFFLQLIINLIILTAFLIGTSKVLEILKNKVKIIEKEERGFSIGSGID